MTCQGIAKHFDGMELNTECDINVCILEVISMGGLTYLIYGRL